MPLRTKGFNLSGLQYFAGANEIRVRASENRLNTLLGIGRAIGSGIEGLGSRLEQRRRESAAARERETARQDRLDEREWQHAEDRARLTGEWREPGTEGPGVQTLEGQRLSSQVDVQGVAKAKREAEDARNIVTDIDRHLAGAMGQMRDLEEMATLSGDVMQHPVWQQEYTARREAVQLLRAQRENLLKRAGAADGLPNVTVEVNGQAIDVNDPALRARSAEEKLERAKTLGERARKTGSRWTEVQAARLATEAQGEIDRAKRADEGRKEASKASAREAQGEDLFRWSLEHPGLAGVPKATKSRLAAAVMAGSLTYAQARQALEGQARSTPEYGRQRGMVENAEREAQGLPTAGEARDQARQDRRERFDFGQRRAADAGERSMRREQEEGALRIVRDIEDDFTRTVEERSPTGKVTLKPVPMDWRKYSDAELRTALNDARLGAEPLAGVKAELERRGGSEPRQEMAGKASPEQSAEAEFQQLPVNEQTPERARAILKKHGLLR